MANDENDEKPKTENKSFFDDTIVQWIALTTTILAVVASLSSSLGSYYSSSATDMTAQVSSNWAYYQANSTKEHIFESEKDLLVLASNVVPNKDLKKKIEEKVEELDKGIIKYTGLKDELSTTNANLEEQIKITSAKSDHLSVGLVYLQIAIMLSSVGALFKKHSLWVVGLIFGIVGLFYSLNGYLLFF